MIDDSNDGGEELLNLKKKQSELLENMSSMLDSVYLSTSLFILWISIYSILELARWKGQVRGNNSKWIRVENGHFLVHVETFLVDPDLGVENDKDFAGQNGLGQAALIFVV